MVRLILFYQRWISPLFAPSCRFYPSCSEYALSAYKTHGGMRGTILTIKRLSRCHPLCDGGYDPVPDTTEKSVESNSNIESTKSLSETACCSAVGNDKS